PSMPGMSSSAPMGMGTNPSGSPARTESPVVRLVTLVELESIALRGNPTLVQARAQIDASMAKSFQAGPVPNPVLGYTTDQIGAQGTPGETQGAFIEQEIVRGNKLRLSRAKYRQEAVEADLQARAQQLRVLNGVRARYFDVLAAHRYLAIQKDLL